MEIKKIVIDSFFPENIASEIDRLARDELYSPIWQTIGWNLMLQKARYAEKWIFIWAYQDGKLLNYAIIEKRKVWPWMHWNFIIGWPLNEIRIEEIELELNKIWIEEKAVFTQIESLGKINHRTFKAWKFKKFIEKHTALISLIEDEEKILSGMKQKWRYNIKVAQKNDITVEKVSPDKQNIDIFYNLLTETKTRGDFSVNSRDYFYDFCAYLERNRIWGLYFAKRDWEVLASGIFVFYWKMAIYYYWASTSDNEKRKFMPAYLLQWNMIMEAKKNWCEIFDFLGIADPEDKDSPLAGVTDFKLKLTNHVHVWPESHIAVHSKFKYMLLSAKNKLKEYLK
ncbi:MAG: methicillin resistance protein [uncultured bacterium (gcode 4)]|uniref:Methicillin resistance protein n=1 Tax=uncultured bacterium (gcode 4) TaxID=1234023 RepID=K2FD43_9BACT|nr:MAG: methicillin resistance protein [uncultured bacterium (gcode 4)]